MTSARYFSVALLTLVVLSGCATASPGGPNFTAAEETLQASPTPEPTQARETGLIAPAQVFGGDCAALFTEAEVSSVMGVDMFAETMSTSAYSDQAAIEQMGGIQCIWRHDLSQSSGGDYLVAWLVLFPQGAVEFQTPDIPCGRPDWQGDDESNCYVDEVRNGIRISGLMSGSGSLEASVEPARAALLEIFDERATPAAAAPVPLPAVGAWAMPMDCQAIVAAADLSAVPGLGAQSYGEGTGGRGGPLPLVLSYIHGDDQLIGCEIIGESASVEFLALGGMRWKSDTTQSEGQSGLDIAGLDEVIATYLGEVYQIDVIDGPNWLQFTVKNLTNAAPIATALVAALDATAAA